jgi:hypothetical protein
MLDRDKVLIEKYADEQYRKLLKEKDQYISLDEYCAKRGMSEGNIYFHSSNQNSCGHSPFSLKLVII